MSSSGENLIEKEERLNEIRVENERLQRLIEERIREEEKLREIYAQAMRHCYGNNHNYNHNNNNNW